MVLELRAQREGVAVQVRVDQLEVARRVEPAGGDEEPGELVGLAPLPLLVSKSL